MRNPFIAWAVGVCALAAGAQTQPTWDSQISNNYPSFHLNFNQSSGDLLDTVSNLTWPVAPGSGGTVGYRQPGYDPHNVPNNFSVAMPSTGYIHAPNPNIANFEWTQPFTIVVQLHNFHFQHGLYVRVPLVMKGEIDRNYGAISPGLYFWLNDPGSGYIGVNLDLHGNGGQDVGAAANYYMPDGFDYTIIVRWDGSGDWTHTKFMVNGSPATATSTGFTSYGWSTPGGLTGASILNSFPVYLMGDPDGAMASNATNVRSGYNTYFDDVAFFPQFLSDAEAFSFFPHTGFYRFFLGDPPTTPTPVIYDNDGCQDTDNLFQLAELVRMHQLGYIRLLGANTTEGTISSPNLYRQMLNAGGLNKTPVSQSAPWPYTLIPTIGYPVVPCGGSQTPANLVTDTAMYRQALASNKGVKILIGGAWRGLYNLLNSPPDAISPLTGQQLFDSRVEGVYAQGGCGAYLMCRDGNEGEDPVGVSYFTQHNSNVPFYLNGYIPGSLVGANGGGYTGPGEEYTRGAADPFAIVESSMVSRGYLDIRAAWDSWTILSAFHLPFFSVGGQGSYACDATAYCVFNQATTGNAYWMTNSNHYPDAVMSWFLNSLNLPNPQYHP